MFQLHVVKMQSQKTQKTAVVSYWQSMIVFTGALPFCVPFQDAAIAIAIEDSVGDQYADRLARRQFHKPESHTTGKRRKNDPPRRRR